MKKVLALVVAFALCFTAVAGCFAVSATTPAITITGADLAADATSGSFTVSGSDYTEKYAQILNITVPNGLTVGAVYRDSISDENMLEEYDVANEENDEFDPDWNRIADGDNTIIRILDIFEGNFTYVITFTTAANTSADAITYAISADVEAADWQDEVIVDVAIDTTNANVVVAGKHTCDFTGEYEMDADGHWQTCSCGATNKASHTPGDAKEVDGFYVVSCTVCGYEISKEEIVPDEPDVDPALTITPNLAINDTITVSFYCYGLSGNAAYDDFYLEVSSDERIDSTNSFNMKTVTDTITMDKMTHAPAAKVYGYQYKGIAMYELGATITAKVYAKKDGVVTAVSAPIEFSVASMAKTLADKSTQTATKTLVADMLVVGYEAQKKFNVTALTDPRLNEDGTEWAGMASASATYDPAALTTTNSDPNKTNVNNAINLAINPGIRYDLKNVPTTDKSLAKFVFTYYDRVNKKDVVTTVYGNDPGVRVISGVYYYQYQDIAFYAGNQTVTVTAYYDDVQLYTQDYCLETVYDINDNIASMQDIVIALIKFGVSAREKYGLN